MSKATRDRICGSTLTANGQPCRNIISAGGNTCRDGHTAGTAAAHGTAAAATALPQVTLQQLGREGTNAFYGKAATKDLIVLSRKGDPQAMRHLVRREDAPAAAVQHVATVGPIHTRVAALRHQNCPLKVLDREASNALAAGAGDTDQQRVLLAIANNPRSSRRTLDKMIRKARGGAAAAGYFAAAAGNPNLSRDVKDLLVATANVPSSARISAMVGGSVPVLQRVLSQEPADSRVRSMASSLMSVVDAANAGLSWL